MRVEGLGLDRREAVTATATLRLAERGKLSLDADVNAFLRSWKVPEGELTAVEKVTLRRIMSHGADTNVHGFLGYASSDPLPTIQPAVVRGWIGDGALGRTARVPAQPALVAGEREWPKAPSPNSATPGAESSSA